MKSSDLILLALAAGLLYTMTRPAAAAPIIVPVDTGKPQASSLAPDPSPLALPYGGISPTGHAIKGAYPARFRPYGPPRGVL